MGQRGLRTTFSQLSDTRTNRFQIGRGTQRSDRWLNSLRLWRGGDGASRFMCENFSPQQIGSVISCGYSLKRAVSNTLMVLELTLITGGNKSFGIKGKNTVRSQILAEHDGTLCLLWKIVILICQKENWNCLPVLGMYKGILLSFSSFFFYLLTDLSMHLHFLKVTYIFIYSLSTHQIYIYCLPNMWWVLGIQ